MRRPLLVAVAMFAFGLSSCSSGLGSPVLKDRSRDVPTTKRDAPPSTSRFSPSTAH